MSSISSLLERINSTPSHTSGFDNGIHSEYRSYYLPATKTFSRDKKTDGIPAELADLWGRASKTAIYEDVLFGQWGLVIHDEYWAQQETHLYRGIYADELNDLDLIFGEFLGDNEKAIISLNPTNRGSIKIMQPLEDKEDWPVVGSSLSEFLEKLLEGGGQKYWL